MADYKRYITQVQENGNVMVSEDVIAAIVLQSAAEVEGVDSISAKPGSELNLKNWNKGMKIMIAEDNDLSIDCNVLVKYGHSVVDVAKNLQNAITVAVESMAGVKVSSVNINVCGIAQQ